MSAETEAIETQQRTWFEKLSSVLLREPQDRKQLIELLRDAQQRDLLDAEALAMIEGVMEVSELQVRDITVPRAQMIVIEHDATLDVLLPRVIESGHSRFPIIGENRDEIIGILLAKDLLAYSFKTKEKPFNIKEVMRPPVFIPESKRLDVLLREFRLNRNHMALVVDEYGGIAGLVTIEDVLEQIVGEIEDEYDIANEPYIKKYNESDYTVKALTPIEDFNEFFDDKLSDEEFDTFGGLVMNKFGYLPKRGETTTMGKYQIKVLNADTRRINLLEVRT